MYRYRRIVYAILEYRYLYIYIDYSIPTIIPKIIILIWPMGFNIWPNEFFFWGILAINVSRLIHFDFYSAKMNLYFIYKHAAHKYIVPLSLMHTRRYTIPIQ